MITPPGETVPLDDRLHLQLLSDSAYVSFAITLNVLALLRNRSLSISHARPLDCLDALVVLHRKFLPGVPLSPVGIISLLLLLPPLTASSSNPCLPSGISKSATNYSVTLYPPSSFSLVPRLTQQRRQHSCLAPSLFLVLTPP